MIKTNELMLGDLVLTNGQIAKVRGLGVYGDIEVRRENTNIYGGEEDIEPILLTAEILENNGFVFESSACSNIECFRLNRDSDGFIEIDNFDGLYFYAMLTYKETKLKYVHHLQHLLRLCGRCDIADNLKI